MYKNKSIKVVFGSDSFTCIELLNDDMSIEVKKGKKIIGHIDNLRIPNENDMDKFIKSIESFLDENYY